MSNESAFFLPAAWFSASFSPQPSHLQNSSARHIANGLISDAICAAALYATPSWPRASHPTKTSTILALPELLPRAKLRKFIYTAFSTPLQYVAFFSKHTLSLFTYSIYCSFLSRLLLLYLSPILCLTSPCDNQTPSQHRLCFFFSFLITSRIE